MNFSLCRECVDRRAAQTIGEILHDVGGGQSSCDEIGQIHNPVPYQSHINQS